MAAAVDLVNRRGSKRQLQGPWDARACIPSPAHGCSIFRDLSPEEREKIIRDNNVCPFCLRHLAEPGLLG
jgi:hypothetical protein